MITTFLSGNKYHKSLQILSKITSLVLAFLFFITPLAPAFAQESSVPTQEQTSTSEQTPAETEQPATTDDHGKKSEVTTPDATSPTDDKKVDQQKEPKKPTEPPTEPVVSALSGEEENPQLLAVGQPRLAKADDAMGALVYEVPIDVPPGRRGLDPEVKLTYNNQDRSQSTLVGKGWSIDIPVIKRLNKKGSNALFNKDDYTSSLDGELIKASATSYVPRAENGTFRKYEYSNNAWKVTDKDGTVYKFGFSASTRKYNTATTTTQIFAWYLEEIRDVNNNYVSFAYYHDHGEVYPDVITYTGSGITPGTFTVEFDRETRSDIATSSEAGFPVVTNYRISEIRTEVAGTWVGKYTLAYANADNDVSSLLASVTHSGRDVSGNVTTLPASNFSYSTSTPDWTPDTGWSSVLVAGAVLQRLADVNGDGLDDMLDTAGAANAVYLNTGASWSYDASWSIPVDLTNATYLADINGDGLVDIVSDTDNAVYLNNGTDWTPDTGWSSVLVAGLVPQRLADVNGDGLDDMLDTAGAANAVYLNTGASWSYDASWSIPVDLTNATYLADINGDGLVDIVSDTDNAVYLNNGTDWTPDTGWSSVLVAGLVPQRLADVNGDGLDDMLDTAGAANAVYLNTGASWSYDASWSIPVDLTNATYLADINGDGLVDIVSDTDNAVYLNNGHRADRLVQISYPQGGTTRIAYKQTPQYTEAGTSTLSNPHLPFALDVVKNIVDYDANGTMATTTYAYGGGSYYYNTTTDRKFAGFASTTKTDPIGAITKTFYHQGNGSQSSLSEYQDHVSKIGKPYRVAQYDASDNLYKLSLNKWDRYAINATSSFVKLASTTEITYDGDGSHKDKAESYTYDNANGNLTQKVELGEVSGSTDGTFTDSGSDKRTTDISYAASSTGWLFAPKQETVKNQSGTTLADTKYYYDALAHGSINKGNPTKAERWVSGSTWVNTQKTYNSYGLVTQDTDERSKNTTYTYDSYNLYVATTTNPLSQKTYREYDYSAGKVTKTIDPNSRVFTTTYDGLDRPLEEKQPDLTTPSTLVTRATYSYNDASVPTSVHKTDYLDASTAVDSYQYFDGLARPIQTRREAESAGTYVTADTVYDVRGLVAKTSLPYFANGSSYASATTTSALFTRSTYDPLARPLSQANAVGTTSYAYADWKTTITDANGTPKDLYSDAYGNLSKVDEHNGASTYTTQYTYDVNAHLTNITDALSNVRAFTYDGLGRRLSAQDLHASGDSTFGTWFYSYDNAGNLASSTNPKSENVQYTYDDINRVLTENFTGTAGTEVTYGYDTGTDGVGRLSGATTTSGATQYLYNPLGLTKSETKTIRAPTANLSSKTTPTAPRASTRTMPTHCTDSKTYAPIIVEVWAARLKTRRRTVFTFLQTKLRQAH